MPLRTESQLETALYRKKRYQRRALWLQIFSLLALAVLFSYTAIYFDELYQPYRSAYPRLSTIFSPLNMVIILLLSSANGFAVYKLRHARSELALSAFMLVTRLNTPQTDHPAFLKAFLQAAGLPFNYSLALVRKINMRHFMSASPAINRAIHRHEQAWVTLSKQV